MIAVADVVAFLDRVAPPSLAADWDNVGLLLGDAAALPGAPSAAGGLTLQSLAERGYLRG